MCNSTLERLGGRHTVKELAQSPNFETAIRYTCEYSQVPDNITVGGGPSRT